MSFLSSLTSPLSFVFSSQQMKEKQPNWFTLRGEDEDLEKKKRHGKREKGSEGRAYSYRKEVQEMSHRENK